MHWLDRLATTVIRQPRLYPRLFSDGWGDAGRIDQLLDRVRQQAMAFGAIVPGFNGERHDGHLLGRFLSPADVLPEQCRQGRVLHVSPQSARQVVLFAASNDHGFATRLRVAEYLAAADIGSVLLEHAFYGQRRAYADGQPVRTVVGFLEMTIAAPSEGVGLVRWLADRGAIPGVSGFSMGGSHAAVVGAMSTIPLAVAPMAASCSSSPVFTEGV